jgi:hypothetical protein
VIYTPDTNPSDAARLLQAMFGPVIAGRARKEDWIVRNASYTAMLRFTLTDEGARLFKVERWCFRGAIDGWLFLAGGKPLEQLARVYLPHLARESFFDLM